MSRECKKKLVLGVEITAENVASPFQRYVFEKVVVPQILEEIAETVAVSEFMLNHIEEVCKEEREEK